ncbi:MAG: inositol monophosphatase [Victivallales bacterium]|nr:inositol monophosphatase [Victivallales bacterium]
MSIDITRISDIAAQAGEMIKARREQLTSREVFHKSSETDIVTVADRESETFLREHLKQAFPDIAFYGEEGSYGDLNSYERVFIVDPIDGTTSYLHGYPFYCISIGLRENGVTTGAVVYLPYLKDIYTAIRGEGAKKNGKPIHVSAVPDFVNAIGATGFGCVRSHVKPDNVDLSAQMIRKLQGFRRSGSAAIDLCHVADGCVDLYWEFYIKPWDYEAGRLIVQEAGGKVTGFDGNPIDEKAGRVFASNGLLHNDMLREFAEYLGGK